MNNRFKRVEMYLNSKGFKVVDMQMPENSVGISNGWVIIEDKKGKVLESTWDDSEWHEHHNSTKKKLLESFYKCEVEF